MKINEAKWDRTSRIIVGIGLLSLVAIGPQTWWGFLGLIPLITGIVGYCPLYRIVGKSTCPQSGST